MWHWSFGHNRYPNLFGDTITSADHAWQIQQSQTFFGQVRFSCHCGQAGDGCLLPHANQNEQCCSQHSWHPDFSRVGSTRRQSIWSSCTARSHTSRHKPDPPAPSLERQGFRACCVVTDSLIGCKNPFAVGKCYRQPRGGSLMPEELHQPQNLVFFKRESHHSHWGQYLCLKGDTFKNKEIRTALRSRVIFFNQVVEVNLLLMKILWVLGFVSQQCSSKQQVCTTTPIVLIYQIHTGIWDFKIVFIS